MSSHLDNLGSTEHGPLRIHVSNTLGTCLKLDRDVSLSFQADPHDFFEFAQYLPPLPDPTLSLMHYLRFPPTREITLNVLIASLVPPGSPRPPPSTTTHSTSHQTPTAHPVGGGPTRDGPMSTVRVRVTVSQQQRYVRDPWHGQFTSFLCIYYLLLSCYISSSLLFFFVLIHFKSNASNLNSIKCCVMAQNDHLTF